MKIKTNWLEGIFMATHAILGHRLRSALTILGVCIGVFSMVGILSLANSLEHSVKDNLSALGNTTLFVHHWPWKDNSQDWFKYWNRPRVSYQDYQKVKNNLQQVEGVNYEVFLTGSDSQVSGAQHEWGQPEWGHRRLSPAEEGRACRRPRTLLAGF